jgi:hypothetical protein
MEIKQAIIEWSAGTILFVLGVGAIVGFVWIGTK